MATASMSSTSSASKRSRRNEEDMVPQEEITDPISGSKLSKISLLGKGSSAEVFLVQGTFRNYSGIMACKILGGKGRNCSNTAQAFINKELISHIRLKDHANIIQYFGHFMDYENAYILLEYCPNKTLHDLISSRRAQEICLNEMEIRYFLKPILSAVEFIHSNRITHRDIKPANILLTKDFEVKIADFGLCDFPQLDDIDYDNYEGLYVLDRAPLVFGCRGAPSYISPEALFGNYKPYNGYASDIWSIGCLMYCLAFLMPPFEEKDENGALDVVFTDFKTIVGVYNFPNDKLMPEEFKNLIRKALCRNPKARPTALTLKEDKYFKRFTPTKITYDVFNSSNNFSSERGAFDRAEAERCLH